VVNIGTEESNTPNSVYHILWDIFGWRPSKIEYRPNELVGTANRIADATKAKEVLGWTPQYDIRRGLEETVDWFITTYSQEQTRQNFEQKLFER
jgi:nucleoside-diphosphate-sugar epimerase